MKTLRNGGQAHGATVAAGRGHHVCVPALDTDTDPVDRSTSAEHGNVVPDVPQRPRRQSAERMVGEKRLVKGTFPHVTPFVSRRPLTRPRQPPFRRPLRPARPGPIRVVSMSARTSTPPAPVANRTARRLRRGTTVGTSFSRGRTAGVESGRAAITPACPLQVPDPIRPLLGPLPVTFSMQCPGPPRQSSAGVTQTTRSATHPVHLWLAERASASRPSVSRRRKGGDHLAAHGRLALRAANTEVPRWCP
jgi:hypothetical protein